MTGPEPTERKPTERSGDRPPPPSLPPAARRPYRSKIDLNAEGTLATARNVAHDFNQLVGTVTLVPAGMGVGRRGRGAGFYCEPCDLTFKDNKQFIEHTISARHRQNTGQKAEVRRATADQVLARIDAAWEREEARRTEKDVDLQARLEARRELEEKEREERRLRRRDAAEKQRLARMEADKARTGYGEEFRIEGEHDEDDMMAALGITGFGSSKR